LREQLGETLASRRQFNQPLEQATTASLPALEAYLARQTKRAEHEKKKRFAVVEQRQRQRLGVARAAPASGRGSGRLAFDRQ
jgi:hypothetical protein